MMSFCKKSVHSFLGLTMPIDTLDISSNNNNNILDKQPSSKCLPLLTTGGGLGLITATHIDAYKSPPNVLESTASFKSSSPPPSPPPTPPLFKKDPGGIGFIDDVGGGVNGLMSCTESLGFESCDERRVDDEINELCSTPRFSSTKVSWRKVGERRPVKKFPPPLSSFNHNGQPSFFLRPVRKDGRLELTEVRIDRPEILRASRQDGRLRLHLIRDEEEEEEEEEEEDIDSNIELQYQEQEYQPKEKQELEGVQEEEEEEEEEIQEEEITGEWRFPMTGEGFRRCHELVSHHRHDYHHHHHHHHHSNHHHNLHVWSQQCVTTT